MWKQTTKHDANRRIWDEELAPFLPDEILDFHVHLMNPGVIPAGQPFSAGGHDVAQYTFADMDQDLADLFPGRQTAAVVFGFPDPAYDFKSNNEYVASNCDHRRTFPFRLIDPAERDHDAVRRDFGMGRFVGMKPYPDYVRGKPVGLVEIPEMLPEWAMEIANDLGLVVMLHIPRPGRIADPSNQRYLVEWCTRYPNAKIVVAHVGRAYYFKNIVGSLDRLKDLPNCYFDLTMVNSWEVMEYAFARVAPHKFLHGSDIPIALAPGKSVEINDGYTYVTPVPWKLSISDDHRKIVFTSFLYEQIRATRKAVDRLGLNRSFVQGLFWDNGMRLLASMPKRR